MKDFFKRHHYAIVTTITVVVLLGFSYQVMAYLISLRQDPPKPLPIVPTRSVVAQKVYYNTITSPVTGDGRVISTQEVMVSAEVRGKILEGDVPFKKGQQFKKDDVLIRIYDKDTAFTLKSRKSSFLQKIAGILPDIKVDYSGSHQNWMDFFRAIDIDTDLPDLPEVGSEQEKIFIASRSILTEYYSIKGDEINLKKHIIHAPFSGTFTDVFMEVGAIANPGGTLANIIRTDSLELEVPIETTDARWIEIGNLVEVISPDESTLWEGRVVRKSSFVDMTTQSMSVFVSLFPEKEKPLFEGQYLKAVFPGKANENVMEIPRNAVFNTNEVFTVEDGKLMKHTITVHKINEKTLIFSGLEEGIELVVEPLVNALENSRVEIVR